MRRDRCARRWGFSLLEVVIVVAIIAILAAIGIPRMSRGAKGANDSALTGDLSTLRNAVDLYGAEHVGVLPTDPNTQLVKYTDVSGATSATKDATHIYGPYVRTIPPLPVGAREGRHERLRRRTPQASAGSIMPRKERSLPIRRIRRRTTSGKQYNKY